MAPPDRILVVDDQPVHRRKLSLAVENLGHVADVAEDGKQALLMMREGGYDLVLLDILMPDMDGFDVMAFMKKDKRLRDIPIIVISALDSEMDSVVRAIEIGAEDFLPKNFDQVLLNARINTALEKKHNRDRELEQLAQFEKLTNAAAILEKKMINPEHLGLDELIKRQDALGDLGRVFAQMATQLYRREKRLRQQARTLKGGGLLLATGVIFGLGIALSRVASVHEAHPFGIALWVNIICFSICTSIAVYRQKLPRISWSLVRFFMVWGVFGTLMGQVLLLWISQFLPAVAISIIIVTEAFIAFALATIMRLEKSSLRRFAGIVLGLIGVVLLIYTTERIVDDSSWIWMMVALGIPLGYACRGLFLSLKMPADLDVIAATGFSAAAGVVIVAPFVYFFDDFVPLRLQIGSGAGILELAVILLAMVSVIGTALRVLLINTTGAVFSSQSSLAITFSGIAWGFILLGESLPATAWMALALLVLGLVVVGPKDELEEIVVLKELDIELG